MNHVKTDAHLTLRTDPASWPGRESGDGGLLPPHPSPACPQSVWRAAIDRAPQTIFSEFESLRIARTSELVKGARQQGELRVVSGVEACKKRNEVIVEMYSSFAAGGSEGLVAQFKHLVEHPFKAGESEI